MTEWPWWPRQTWKIFNTFNFTLYSLDFRSKIFFFFFFFTLSLKQVNSIKNLNEWLHSNFNFNSIMSMTTTMTMQCQSPSKKLQWVNCKCKCNNEMQFNLQLHCLQSCIWQICAWCMMIGIALFALIIYNTQTYTWDNVIETINIFHKMKFLSVNFQISYG